MNFYFGKVVKLGDPSAVLLGPVLVLLKDIFAFAPQQQRDVHNHVDVAFLRLKATISDKKALATVFET